MLVGNGSFAAAYKHIRSLDLYLIFLPDCSRSWHAISVIIDTISTCYQSFDQAGEVLCCFSFVKIIPK